jgi:hypothetical protein
MTFGVVVEASRLRLDVDLALECRADASIGVRGSRGSYHRLGLRVQGVGQDTGGRESLFDVDDRTLALGTKALRE